MNLHINGMYAYGSFIKALGLFVSSYRSAIALNSGCLYVGPYYSKFIIGNERITVLNMCICKSVIKCIRLSRLQIKTLSVKFSTVLQLFAITINSNRISKFKAGRISKQSYCHQVLRVRTLQIWTGNESLDTEAPVSRHTCKFATEVARRISTKSSTSSTFL